VTLQYIYIYIYMCTFVTFGICYTVIINVLVFKW